MTKIAKLVVDLTQRTSDSPGRPLPGDSPAVGMISARLLQIGVVGEWCGACVCGIRRRTGSVILKKAVQHDEEGL